MFSFRTTPIAEQTDKALLSGPVGSFVRNPAGMPLPENIFGSVSREGKS